jgi:hypothetical protein
LTTTPERLKCSICGQPLTYIRTRDHHKKWYCYVCEKFTTPASETETRETAVTREAMYDNLKGMSVVDSKATLIGRVREVTLDPTRGPMLIVETTLPFSKVSVVGHFIQLSEPFESLRCEGSMERIVCTPKEARETDCATCGFENFPIARFCIKCGTKL